MEQFKANPHSHERQIRLLSVFIDEVLLPLAFKKVAPLKAYIHPSKEPLPFAKRKSPFLKRIHEGEKWGKGEFPSAWFHVVGEVPNGYDPNELLLSLDVGGEALLYYKEGHPLKGFSSGNEKFSDTWWYLNLKKRYPLKDLVSGRKISLWLDGGNNSAYRNDPNHPGVFKEASLVIENKKASEILYDLEVLFDYLRSHKPSDPYFAEVLSGLQKVRSYYLYDWPAKYELSKKITAHLLSLESSSSFRIYAVGHSHLDLAWLWPVRETKRKAVRTIANSLYLLDNYPNYIYSISQPRQVEWIKENAPDLFEKMREYEKMGRLELLGGSYVECDTNLIGEESLFRQMLYGQKFWLENFGHYASVGWLPDCFGFSPAIPSVLAKTSQPYFVTAKMAWCWSTLFPYLNFRWAGLDGSQVLTHLMTNPNSYVAFALPSDIKATEQKSKEIEPATDKALMSYGVGDGGGGPNEDVLERLGRMSHKLDLPSITLAKASDFFESLFSLSSRLPIYQGEMYLENHQGTLTSQSEIKQRNRATEEKLKVAETYLAEMGQTDYDQEITEVWKEALLYQFHDILPGSSIRRVHDETVEGYKALDKKIDDILIRSSEGNYSPSYKKGFYVRNFLQYEVNHLEKVKNCYYVFSLPKNGETDRYSRFKGIKIDAPTSMRTKYFSLSFHEDGSLKSIIDVINGKEILAGYGNKLRVYKDGYDPDYSNWNILEDYREQPEVYMDLIERKAKRYGPITEIVDIYSYKESRLRQTILIDDDSRIIRFHHEVDWKNDNCLLKSCFALKDMPPIVRSDCQFGHLERSTLNDTLHHEAQFEVSAYKWCDFSDEEKGVSFLNKTKAGFYAKEGKYELSLLRSANFPCPKMDQWPTSYSYAIYVHNCPFEEANIDKEANAFNAKVLYFKKQAEPNNAILLSDDGVEVSCFKNAYNGKGYIIRLYERNGLHKTISLSLPASLNEARLVDGLEDPLEAVDYNNLSFRPFEIKTIWIY